MSNVYYKLLENIFLWIKYCVYSYILGGFVLFGDKYFILYFFIYNIIMFIISSSSFSDVNLIWFWNMMIKFRKF